MPRRRFSSRKHAYSLILAAAATALTGRAEAGLNFITDNFIGGAAPNNQWLDPTQWSTGTVPNDDPVNKYLVDIPSNEGVVLQNTAQFTSTLDTVYDLNLAGGASVTVDTPLSVEDAINGSGANLNVIGSTLTLAPQPTNAGNPANYYVQAGGTAILGYTALTLNNGGTALSADGVSGSGAGSVLDLHTVQTLTYGIPNTGGNQQYTVSASNGGTVNLSGLTAIGRSSVYQGLNLNVSNGGTINLNSLQTIDEDGLGADAYTYYAAFFNLGAGSSIALPALSSANLMAFNFNSLPAGSQVNLPVLHHFSYSGLNLPSGATFNAPQLTDVDNSTITVAAGSTLTTGALTDIDGAAMAVTGGAVLNNVAATSDTFSNGGSTLSADGTGSVLDLHTVQTLTYGIPNTGGNQQYTVSASNGGTVNLSGLTAIGRSSVYQGLNLNVSNGGTINLNSLQTVDEDAVGSASDAYSYYSTFINLATKGTITIGNLAQSQFTSFNVTDSTGKLIFLGNANFGDTTSLSLAAGSTLQVGGNFSTTLTNPVNFQASTAILAMNGLNAQSLEVAGADVGAVNPGNNGNFGFGELQIGSTTNPYPTEVDLVDAVNNGNRGSNNTPEALYLFGVNGQGGLTLMDGSVLLIGSLNAYDFQDGSWLSLQSLLGPGQTIVPFTLNGSDGYIARNLTSLAATWVNPGNGSWTNAANWSIDAVPGTLNDVTISTVPGVIVTGPTADNNIRSLTVDSLPASPRTVLNLPGPGTTTVSTAVQVNGYGTINLQGGTLITPQLTVLGTFTTSPGSALQAGSIVNSGTLSNAGSLVDLASFSNNGVYNQSAGTAKFGQITGLGSVNITGGTATLAAGGGTSQISSLTLSGTGSLDITSNPLIVNYGSNADPSATIRGYLKSASHGGLWNGTGLTSSSVEAEVANAIAHGGGVYGIGYADGAKDANQHVAVGDQIVYEPALIGDANLDGSVTFIDLGIVAQNLGAINSDWAHGDFNYDGTVNFLDIGLLAQNLNKTTLNTPLSELISDPSPALTAQWNLAVAEIQANQTQPANLPEPGVAGLLAAAAGGFIMRRRRLNHR